MSKTKKDKFKNQDLLGNEWALAPGGWDRINQCQSRLVECYFELQSLGALLCSLENADLTGEDLQGTGLMLRRLSKRISKISKILSSAVHKNKV